ncbi:hypothetical protein P280DRAFT_482024 [Massarina eburnea CBS 473.64]|uniref:Mid2 domain-containing protein n=1 Tax=Massarina eburnea CBS 473.64 TaxID=1395130 RepID=A0A6A6RU13_9PLEO|nr:hypothetical protein P280DRAFT_482024 [Massarina eburnea CBS 473.64]
MTVLPRASSTPSDTCYTLNGMKTGLFDTLSYIPCNATAIENGQHSACCASTDLCLTNGLCKYNAPKDAPAFNEYWRIGCTDPTYQDASCPKQCANIEKDDAPTHLVFQCPGDGDWCCGTGKVANYKNRGVLNTTCCNMDNLAFSGEEAVIYATASLNLDVKTSLEATQSKTATGSSATSTAFSTASVPFETGAATSSNSLSGASSPTSSAGASSSQNSNISTGVGIGIGIPCAVALFIALVYLIHRYLRNQKSTAHRELPSPTTRSTARSPATLPPFVFPAPPEPQPPPEPSPTLASMQQSAAPAISQPKSRVNRFFFWKRGRGADKGRYGEEAHADIRHTNPHAFWSEAHGQDMAVEMDVTKPPVEIWTPGGNGRQWSNEDAGNIRGREGEEERLRDAKYGFSPPESPGATWRGDVDGYGYGGGNAASRYT